MATTIKIGEEVTVGTTATEYFLDASTAQVDSLNFTAAIYTDSANSGTIQFSIGGTPSAERAVPADKNVIMSGIQNGTKNLWAEGSAAGQKFTVS